jgi:hypothetical protein
VLPESHDLLSGDEEVMAQKLVYVECEAVVLHSGLKIDLLCSDKIIRNHDILRSILFDLVVIIEETCGESCRSLFLEVFPHLGLRACELGGSVAS